MRAVNGLSCFVAAWVCGVIAFALETDALISAGGALLLAAAVLYAARADDPLRRTLNAIPDGMPWSNVPRGRPRQIFGAVVLGIIGLAWLIGGVVGAF